MDISLTKAQAKIFSSGLIWVTSSGQHFVPNGLFTQFVSFACASVVPTAEDSNHATYTDLSNNLYSFILKSN
jgi:hypothetical protein